MFKEFVIALFLALALVGLFLLLIALIRVPIMIADARGLTGTERTTIVILSWLGIFFGITWVVALVLSLVWNVTGLTSACNLEKLERLNKLYKDKAITKAEYDAAKAKLLG